MTTDKKTVEEIAVAEHIARAAWGHVDEDAANRIGLEAVASLRAAGLLRESASGEGDGIDRCTHGVNMVDHCEECAAVPYIEDGASPVHEHRFDVVTAWEPQCRTRIVVRTADRVETTWTNRYEPCRWGDAERVVARKYACSVGDCTATRKVAR